MDAPSLVWNVVASLTQPLWDGGRIAAGVDTARSFRLRAEMDYRDAVAVAFKEVADALTAQDTASRNLEIGRQRAQQLAVAADLTRRRHEAGEASRLLVIEAERAALNARAENAEIQRALVASQAELFRALGGGWAKPVSG
jgi:outer membrane protein TolC